MPATQARFAEHPPSSERATQGGSARGRLYGGLSTDERDAQRRSSVLDAGLELFGTKGFGPTSMTEIADQAQVAFRYVARLFPDKESLLEAVFVRIQDQVLAAVAQSRRCSGAKLSVQIRDGLHAALTTYAADPRRVRVSCLEVMGVSQRFEDLRRRTSQRFVDQLVHGLGEAVQAGEPLPKNYARLGVGLVGAVTALLADWASGSPEHRAQLDDVIEAACLIYVRTLGLAEES